MGDELRQIVPYFPVRDVVRSQEWYADQLDFASDWQTEGLAQVSLDGQAIFLVSAGGREPRPCAVCVGRELVDDVDERFELYSGRGVTVLDRLETKPWEMRSFTIADPDGHRLTFMQRAHPDKPAPRQISIRRQEQTFDVEERISRLFLNLARESGKTPGELLEWLTMLSTEVPVSRPYFPDVESRLPEILRDSGVDFTAADLRRFADATNKSP